MVIMLAVAGCQGNSCSAPGAGSATGSATGSTLPPGSSAATSAEAIPTPAWTIAAGPTPAGMLPLGPTTSNNQPPKPCTPGIPIGISSPILYEALPADQFGADPPQAGVGEIVNYDWGGHKPLAAASLGVTVPALAGTLRPRAPLMRMVLATSDGVCFAQWRVTARPLLDFDGAQDSNSGWIPLGEGSAQTDATVVAGLPEGDWIVHIHLAFAPVGTTPSHASESYARVVVGDRLTVQPPVVPAPDPAADCAGKSLQPGRNPDIELMVPGMHSTSMGVHGTVSTGHGGSLLPAEMPDTLIPTQPGSTITLRTQDGSCGKDWSGYTFLPVPDALAGPYAEGSRLPTNNGTGPNASAQQLVGAMMGLAPAPGEWLLAVTFWFGGPEAATYYWRITVTRQPI